MARRPLFDTLRDMRAGLVIEELEASLQELVQAVMTTNKGGKLTLTLEVKPMNKGTEAVVVTDLIKLAKPKIESLGTVMFPTPEGNVQRTHPKQDELPGLSLASSSKTA
jgi:hypothetical protein